MHKSRCNLGLQKHGVGLNSNTKRNQTLPTCFLDRYQGGVKTVRDKNIFFVCRVLGKNKFLTFRSSLIADDSYYFII